MVADVVEQEAALAHRGIAEHHNPQMVVRALSLDHRDNK
jgi:hypothetical protein